MRGYNMHVQAFFNNIGGIMLLAFGGTIVSTIVIAVFMWLVGSIGISYKITFYNSCLFGSIVSATDPVTVLAIFGRIDVNKDLNALVFGEAVLNDAVAIVLYRVIGDFGGKDLTAATFFWGVLSFIKIFLGSLIIGLVFGLAAALLFRSQFFRNEEVPLEAALLVLLAYSSFYFADGLRLSGIVSIMVCAMFMAKYVRPNLMEATDTTVHSFFRMFAWLSETFIFVYIGIFLFFKPQPWGLGLFWSFIIFCFAALALSRALNVYPNMMLVNFSRPPEMRFPQSQQFMLWWSGLRGAMAFALAILGRDTMRNEGADPELDGKVVLTATFFLVLVTVLVNGGATTYLLDRLDLKEVPNATLPPSAVDMFDIELQPKQARDPGIDSVQHAPAGNRTLRDKLHEYHRSGGIQERFRSFDDKLSRVLIGSSGVPGHAPVGAEVPGTRVPARNAAPPQPSSSSPNPFVLPEGELGGVNGTAASSAHGMVDVDMEQQ